MREITALQSARVSREKQGGEKDYSTQRIPFLYDFYPGNLLKYALRAMLLDRSMGRKIFDKSSLFSFGTPGPFQIIECETLDLPSDAPRRRYDCPHYETCLNMAAALNWDNFTCRGCSGELNASLLWRAQSESRKDRVVKEICSDLTPCSASAITSDRSNQTEETITPSSSDISVIPYQALRTVGKR